MWVKNGAQGRNRTTDTRIFSALHLTFLFDFTPSTIQKITFIFNMLCGFSKFGRNRIVFHNI